MWSAIGRMLDEKLFPARAESALRTFKGMMEELGASAAEGKVDDLLRQILERTGYARMLQADNDPEAESRLGNLNELVNAASEAAERGEDIAEFLDHAALVSDTDNLDERAPGLVVHPAQCQRPGVSDRVPCWNGRRALPAHSRARFQSRHGRRTASLLCRHDAFREAAVSDIRALPQALRRRPTGRHHPLKIPARSSARTSRDLGQSRQTFRREPRKWIYSPNSTKCAKQPSAISNRQNLQLGGKHPTVFSTSVASRQRRTSHQPPATTSARCSANPQPPIPRPRKRQAPAGVAASAPAP